jgi:hypothetical protein
MRIRNTFKAQREEYKELYENTLEKKEHCIKEGYNYIEIWECEWKKISKSNELLQNYIDELINKNNYLKKTMIL